MHREIRIALNKSVHNLFREFTESFEYGFQSLISDYWHKIEEVEENETNITTESWKTKYIEAHCIMETFSGA